MWSEMWYMVRDMPIKRTDSIVNIKSGYKSAFHKFFSAQTDILNVVAKYANKLVLYPYQGSKEQGQTETTRRLPQLTASR